MAINPTYDNSAKAIEVLKDMPPQRTKQSHKGSAQKIRKLVAKHPNMPARELAKRAGCKERNVYTVLQKLMRGRTSDQLSQYQERKADAFDSVALDALLSITPAKLAKASAPALMMVAGTAFDKSQLARGQATGINVVALLDVVEAIKAQESSRARGIGTQVIDAAPVS